MRNWCRLLLGVVLIAGGTVCVAPPSMAGAPPANGTLRPKSTYEEHLPKAAPHALTLNFWGRSGPEAQLDVFDRGSQNALSYRFVRPDGTTFDERTDADSATTPYQFDPETFVISRPLDATGWWQVVITPVQDAASGFSLGLQFVTELDGGTLTPGSRFTAQFTQPQQYASYTFAGQTGQIPSFLIRTFAQTLAPGIVVSLFRPDGSVFRTSGTRYGSGQAAYAQLARLDATGTWRLTITPNAGATGTMQAVLGLADEHPATPITIGHTAFVAVAQPGQTVEHTFDVQPGTRPVVSVTGADWTRRVLNEVVAGTAVYDLVDANGAPESLDVFPCGGESDTFPKIFCDSYPVAAAEQTLTLVVDPAVQAVGHVHVRVDLVSDQHGTITPGQPTAVSIAQRGQHALLAFPGTQGQQVSAQVDAASWHTPYTANGVGSAALDLLAPDGSDFCTLTPFDYDRHIPSCDGPLPSSGTWSLAVIPLSGSIGSTTVTLTTS